MATAAVEQQVPSWTRVVPGSTNISPATFPSATAKPGSEVNAAQVAADFVDTFNKQLSQGDYQAISKSFTKEGFWRDHLALTWEFRTIQEPSAILEFLQTCSGSKDGFRLKSIAVDASTPTRVPSVVPIDADGKVLGVQLFFTLKTAIGGGSGVARLVADGDGWKIYTFYTSLREIEGHEELVNKKRDRGVQHGMQHGRKNWSDRRAVAADFGDGREPAVLIVGAGQAGLTAAARLKMLGVDALIIDQNDRIGDNWRKRYHQLVLHDPVWYDHMPYINFPPHWPIYTPKDKLAEFFESYAKLLELDVWMKTTLGDSKWDESKGEWTVTVNRKKDDGSNETRTFHPRHVIQATGHSGKKNLPDIKGIESFKGHSIQHSSEWPGARENCQGKKAIVVGSCNSAHDIAQDYVEKGYDVTIVQRSSTHVVSTKALTETVLLLYSEEGPPVEDADLIAHSMPNAVLKALHIASVEKQNEIDKDTIEGLTRAGFKVDNGPDQAGLLYKYFQRGGGYYIDVGASALIIQGRIKVKQGQEIAEVLPNGLRFADGSELEADEIVLATGYQNMRTHTRVMFGDGVADKVTDVWGFNEEGEWRTIWQASGHPGFWLHGGNLALCRYYSRLLALQIKGLEEGLYKHGEK